ncbi:MAG TPA: 4a-hydroxytetrahydrobiopterin dehydratase [Candidatus Nanoarchaeia archaeon]|nr:4a-hydroxytetrahydrobiopterin dehydratase [Candidatus Nanoarchaeia archaeon]
MNDELSSKKCTVCQAGAPVLKPKEIEEFQKKVDGNWRVIDNHHLEREFKLTDFKASLDLTNKIGRIAEEEQHHPDICLSYGKVVARLFTHKIDGLHENDFILAAKIDKIVKARI